MTDVSGWLVKHVASDETIPARAAKLLTFFVNGGDYMREVLVSHCESGVMLAERLGFGNGVQSTVRYLWEQWDGKSAAYGMKGDETPVTSRILHFSQVMEVGHRFGGKSYSANVAEQRRGGDFDPDIVDAYLSASGRSDFWAAFEMDSAKQPVIDIRPESQHDQATAERVENMCDLLADFIDIKSPFTWGHSKVVAETTEGVARQMGLGDKEVARLRRAALVHDLGKVMVPCSAMEKEDGYTPDEIDRIRLHTYYSERILSRVEQIKDLAPDAAAHHEASDGSGYHRQLKADQTTLGQRVLAVADRYAMLVQSGDRSTESVLLELKTQTGSQSDPDCYEGLVGYLEGRPATTKRATGTGRRGNLSDREVEVIQHLAEGMRNKEIADALVISDKTVERHLENIYNKLDVTSRTSAVVFAVQNGLVAQPSPRD